MKPLLLALLLALPLSARELKFRWDTVPGAVGYALWTRETPEDEWQIHGSTLGEDATSIAGTFPDTAFEAAVTAWNWLAPNVQEHSEKSVPLSLPAKLAAPGGLKIELTIHLQTSDNLSDWREVASISWPADAAPAQFFRLQSR